MHRFDVRQLVDFVLLEPGEKRARCAVIGLTRVAVADGGGEEFEEAANSVLASAGDRGGMTMLPEIETAVRAALVGTRSFMGLV
jgi:hypothetical protein